MHEIGNPMSADLNENIAHRTSPRVAYFDCFSGISGDMIIGALLDLGVPIQWLEEKLHSQLMLDGFQLTSRAVTRQRIGAQAVTVVVKDDQSDRDFASICELINGSRLADDVKKKSLAVFDCIAEAEAHVHGCVKEAVHFHEVGGIDAIVDIVGAVIGLDYLNIQHIVASRVAVGQGYTMSRHGKLPVPAPATLAILKGHSVYGVDIEHELVTPTGAAILVTMAQSFSPMPAMTILDVGYGAGSRDFVSHPNVLRVVLGEVNKTTSEEAVVIETCIDDMNPEIFGYVMERLFMDGALDVYWIPIFMKKNRPGTKIQVLCTHDRRDHIVHRILSETTSIGVRFYPVHRHILHRERIKLGSQYGEVTVKKVTLPDGCHRWIPEYDECRKIAAERDIPIRSVYEAISQEIATFKTLPGTRSD